MLVALRIHAHLPTRHSRVWLLALVALVTASIAWAVDYYFPISAAGPSYATSTYDSDAVAEFDGANAIARTYLHYTSQVAKDKAVARDYVYVSYHDGKIAKFKITSATLTIRLRFESLVPAVPAGAKTSAFSPYSSVYDRSDYLNGAASWFYEEERLPTGSVTVIQYQDGGPICPIDGCPILQGAEAGL